MALGEQSRKRAPVGFGEERRYVFDQDAGTLALFFPNGKRAVLPAQIIASFVPGAGSARWAWANESVDPALALAAAALRDRGEAAGVAELKAPEPRLDFERLVGFSALAALRFGCAGLYRCLRDYSSVLVGFGVPDFQTKNGAPLSPARLWPKGHPEATFEAEALAVVRAFDAGMYEIDREYRDRTRPGDLDEALDRKDLIFARFWQPKNDLWRPNSIGWPPEHDPSDRLSPAVVPRRRGDCYVVRWPGQLQHIAYVVEAAAGEARITDIDREWGEGLVWLPC